ncbi:MAG: tetratricopeptide repeat protein [Burkholderiaceae bacterium]|nr:tetratricopeptide repeat protein [Burkholderiaceae bacterium]
MMERVMRAAALVLVALAPIACATEGGLLQGGADLFDEEEQSKAVAVAPAPASAAAAQSASDAAQSESATTVQSASAPAVQSASAAELAALQSQAEDAYRARRFDEAVIRYERLLALQPSNAQAWLRLGNVHHRRRDWFKALTAYRRAAARSHAGVDTEPSLRAKAIYNVALINLELARQSLRSLERLGEGAGAISDPSPLARETERTQRRLDAFSSTEGAARGAGRP